MPNAFFQVPYPENEPVLPYGPGSPEREFALRAARAVGQDRFVLRVGDLEECVGHGESFWVQR